MKRAHIIVSGKVQGVFYRDFVRKEADKFGISGFVRNLQDGTVEIVAEGEEDKLNIFMRECKRGSLLAFVKNAEINYEEPTGEFEGFGIRF
ncbi:acylphosphatase [Candidatus Woesearchaeota archaeon]|nr:acylphosphatase [Candidatus Woesearchaeota archaeon]